MASYGRTRSEMIADGIAKRLVKVLAEIEMFTDDPEMILDSAKIEAYSSSQGVKEGLTALRQYYISEEPNDTC